MISIKLQCGCGQRFAFDVEPVNGRMPVTINCPACGVDTTGAANAALALEPPATPPTPVAPPAPVAPVNPGGLQLTTHSAAPPPTPEPPPHHGGLQLRTHSSAPAPAPAPEAEAQSVPTDFFKSAGPQVGQIDRAQAEREAKAKIFWGDSPESVIRLLVFQGVDRAEATALVDGMVQERRSATRANGVRKIMIGLGLVLVPVITYFIMASVGYVDFKILGGTCAVGLYGFYIAFDGVFMVVSPKMESGDVADQ